MYQNMVWNETVDAWFCLSRFSEVNSTLLFTSKLANQCVQKALLTCVVYMNTD